MEELPPVLPVILGTKAITGVDRTSTADGLYVSICHVSG